MDAFRPEILASEFAISAGHYLASQVGYEILYGGGNAVDAGVAAGLALGVVQSDLAGTIACTVDAADAAAGSREAGIEAAHTAFYKGDIAAAIADYHSREGGWLTREDLAARRTLIDPAPAWPHMPPPGDPRSGAATMEVPETGRAGPPGVDPHATRTAPALSLRDTSYVCVADRRGNVFSATPSDTACDSPLIPGTGICPSSRGSQGRADPAHPASVVPGKRPRLTPNPAMALEHGRPRLVFGTPGGDVQIQAMAQLLGNRRWFAMGVQQAIEAPRFATYSFPSSFAPNTYAPGLMALEGRIAAEVGAALERRGHQVERWPDFTRKAGALCAIEIEADTGRFRAGADPRRSAYALGR